MRKTNIRINGYYLARQGNQYFKTKINNHQTWIEEENIVDFVQTILNLGYLVLRQISTDQLDCDGLVSHYLNCFEVGAA